MDSNDSSVVFCSANIAAHRLARMALVIGKDMLWNESIPNCICNAVFHE